MAVGKDGSAARRGAGGRIWLLTIAALVFPSLMGCAYMKDRGNDAADIFDIGVMTSSKPGFALYFGGLNIVPLGYANVEGTTYGLAQRHFGALQTRYQAASVILWGREQIAYDGDYDANDPNSPASWRVGFIGLIDGPRPAPKDFIACPKAIHLGFIGLTVNCKPNQLLDFILGLATIDIMNDDTYSNPAAKPAPAQPETTLTAAPASAPTAAPASQKP